VLLADEPISMLDVSVRLGILNLLKGLCDNEHLAVLYITHDIASARYIADETIVMYAGQIVERSHGTALVDDPTHPYTQLLIASVPNPADPTSQASETKEHSTFAIAEVGCRFAPRCPHAMDICRAQDPPDFKVGEGHVSHCWLHANEPEAVVELAPEVRRREGETTKT
jgi:peptide/nickel transport system ATP-binding protein